MAALGPAGELDFELDGIRCTLSLLVRRGDPPALTRRERQVAALIACGYTNNGIANALGISVWTVSTHVRRSFTKLGVSSRAALVHELRAREQLGRLEQDRPRV